MRAPEVLRRRRRPARLLATALLAAAWWLSAHAELGMELMQTMEDVNKSLASNLSLRDQKASLVDAAELDRMFAEVEAHFVARGDAANGVEISRQSRGLAQQVHKAVTAGDFDAATDAATQLSRACRRCHTFYKKE